MGIPRLTSCSHSQEEEPMSSSEHGTQAGGRIVVQHQTEEAMAAVLLARKGKSTVVWEIVVRFSCFFWLSSYFCPFPGEGVRVPVGWQADQRDQHGVWSHQEEDPQTPSFAQQCGDNDFFLQWWVLSVGVSLTVSSPRWECLTLSPFRHVALRTSGIRRAVSVEQGQRLVEDGCSSPRSRSDDHGRSRYVRTTQ